MNFRRHFRNWARLLPQKLWTDERASQIVEFALSLPLLVFFVIGIFDFSSEMCIRDRYSRLGGP